MNNKDWHYRQHRDPIERDNNQQLEQKNRSSWLMFIQWHCTDHNHVLHHCRIYESKKKIGSSSSIRSNREKWDVEYLTQQRFWLAEQVMISIDGQSEEHRSCRKHRRPTYNELDERKLSCHLFVYLHWIDKIEWWVETQMK